MAGATTFAFRAMDLAGAATAGEVEAESKAQVTEQLRQRGLIVLDVSEKSEPFKHRGPLQALEERRHARAGGLLAPVRHPGRLRDADAAHPAHARGADPGRRDPRGDRRHARRRRGGQHARAGDGAPPQGLRPPLPGDGPLRRAVRAPRGRARPDRLPGRENRRPAPPGQIGADVPGAGLRLRRRRAGRDRRLRDPGLRQHLQRNRRRTPRRKRRAAGADAALRRRLQRADRLLVRAHPGPRPRLSSPSSAGRGPNAAKKSGTASPCASRSRSAT